MSSPPKTTDDAESSNPPSSVHILKAKTALAEFLLPKFFAFRRGPSPQTPQEKLEPQEHLCVEEGCKKYFNLARNHDDLVDHVYTHHNDVLNRIKKNNVNDATYIERLEGIARADKLGNVCIDGHVAKKQKTVTSLSPDDPKFYEHPDNPANGDPKNYGKKYLRYRKSPAGFTVIETVIAGKTDGNSKEPVEPDFSAELLEIQGPITEDVLRQYFPAHFRDD